MEIVGKITLLLEILEELGKSIDEIADFFSFNKKTFANWQSGRIQPQRSSLTKISKALSLEQDFWQKPVLDKDSISLHIKQVLEEKEKSSSKENIPLNGNWVICFYISDKDKHKREKFSNLLIKDNKAILEYDTKHQVNTPKVFNGKVYKIGNQISIQLINDTKDEILSIMLQNRTLIGNRMVGIYTAILSVSETLIAGKTLMYSNDISDDELKELKSKFFKKSNKARKYNTIEVKNV